MRDVIGSKGDKIDMRRLRPTDMKNNRDVMMPGPAPAIVEAENNVRIKVWSDSFNSYRMRNCKVSGEQSKSNLTLSQQLGLKSITKKIAKLELLVLQADKGKRFVVVSEDVYRAMAHDHVGKDIPTTQQEIARSQRVLSSTAKAMGNILGLGRHQSKTAYSRCMDNAGGEAEDVPNLKVLPKVPQAGGSPRTSPVQARGDSSQWALITGRGCPCRLP